VRRTGDDRQDAWPACDGDGRVVLETGALSTFLCHGLIERWRAFFRAINQFTQMRLER